jgi:nitrite reductase/ring-hydroxylating ferredoxin subunit
MIKKIIIEIKALFGLGKWYKVFSTQLQLENAVANGKSIVVEVENMEVCLARKEHHFYAFLNTCPHNQMPLNKGKFNDNNEWVCPYHLHCFELNKGKNNTMPSTSNLSLLPIKINNKGIFIFYSSNNK